MLSIRAANVNDVALPKALICELAEWEGQAAGYALFFGSYSTWEGRPGLFLEDLFVREPFRGKGIGKALLGAREGGRNCAARELLRHAMGSAGLESTGDRLLSAARRFVPRSMEIRAADRRGARAGGKS